jgi:hypothetical protein
MHVCVFVCQGGNTSLEMADLKKALIKENIDIDKIEWTVSEY